MLCRYLLSLLLAAALLLCYAAVCKNGVCCETHNNEGGYHPPWTSHQWNAAVALVAVVSSRTHCSLSEQVRIAERRYRNGEVGIYRVASYFYLSRFFSAYFFCFSYISEYIPVSVRYKHKNLTQEQTGRKCILVPVRPHFFVV